MIPMKESFDSPAPPPKVVIYRLRTIGLEPKANKGMEAWLLIHVLKFC